ncbi:MAG: glycogen-binding domain-containing protein [Elusimicrobiota bacterium]|nr:glycogen-binding domain-containing protein [Elusimicrobiota bacterium]
MTKKILLWAGFILGIAIVAFPSLMLVERVREMRESKPKIVKEKPAKPEPVKREDKAAVEERTGYPRITGSGVVFQYKAAAAQKVFVAGTFNNWDGRKGVMAKNPDGFWEAVLTVKPGRYTYKFKADGVWALDPQNPVSADDGKGGRVSVLIVE